MKKLYPISAKEYCNKNIDFEYKERDIFIDNLYVNKLHRNKGVAKELINNMIEKELPGSIVLIMSKLELKTFYQKILKEKGYVLFYEDKNMLIFKPEPII